MSALSTLSNIRVPIEDDNLRQPLLMPKLQYRFRVMFRDFGGISGTRELTKQVTEVTRPNLTFQNIPLDVYNSRANIAGKHTWELVNITFRDDASNFVQRSVGEQLQRQFDFWEQASAAVAGSYKFQTDVEILDGGNGAFDPVILERFSLVGCYIQSANYNTLNYSTSEAVTVSLAIQYDNAIQYGRGGNNREGVGDDNSTISQTGAFSTVAQRTGFGGGR